MKPFLLVSGDFVTTGGMDRANYALAEHLARRGHPVHLVAHRVAEELTALPNVHFHRVPKPANSYFLGGMLLSRYGRFWGRRIAREGGRVVVNGGNCSFGDVNWVHYVHAAYCAESAGSLPRRVKQRIAHQVFRRGERQSLARARLVLANSEVTRSHLVGRLPQTDARVEVVYYGIDMHRFRPASSMEREARRRALGWPGDRPMVCFIGALGDRRKGFDTLFAAWQLLCADPRWDADLVVVGAGAELSAWRERSSQSGIAARIRFLGFRSDVPDLLPVCDLLVAPTRYEAYGLGVHEALCCGVPAMVSRAAGVAERFPAALQGLLIQDPDDGVGLARQMRAWRTNASEVRSETNTFSHALRRLSWDDMAERIVEIMEDEECSRCAS